MLKVSIITINFNSSSTIQRTIDSIESQTYINTEWILIDGNSNDESRFIIENNKSKFDVFISEPDRGIAHAMNKGLSLSTGEIVIYMNAGDTFYSPTSLSEAINLWDYKNYDWITSSASVKTESGKKLYDRLHTESDWKPLLMNGCRIFHASTLVKTKILRDIGGFSENYKSSMDYELWLRLVRNNHYPQIIYPILSIFFVGGTSSNLLKRYEEDRKARIENDFTNPINEIIIKIIVLAKYNFRMLKKFSILYIIKELFRI